MNKIYVVGIGPGSYDEMTVRAVKCLNECSVIVGYTVYIDLVKEHFSHAQLLSTPMKKEKDRCIMAFEKATQGNTTAMVCSGDAGVYAMAGLIIELGKDYPETEIEVVSGITAALSGGAILGSPLTHDFAVISLSDLLTPWEKIEKRISSAADGDFVTCIYNPSSKKRSDYLRKACEIMLQYKDENTVCAVTKNIGRDGQYKKIMPLLELKNYEADMFTTVFIGNSQTKEVNGYMVTPRGYQI